MTKLALGTAQFGMDYGVANKTGQPHSAEVAAILNLASYAGIDLLDTAQSYGNSEDIIGSLQASRFNIITKIGKTGVDFSLEVRPLLLGSLERLQQRSIYGLLIHNVKKMITDKECGSRIADSLLRLKDEGLVIKIGVSVYTPEELTQILEIFTPDIVQFPCCPIDGRWLRSGLLLEMKKLGVERHVRSIFLQGLLALDQNNLPSWALDFSNTISAWHNWCAELNMTSIEAAINLAVNDVNFDQIIFGVERVSQLKSLVEWSNGKPIEAPEYLRVFSERLLDVRRWGA